MNPYERRAMMEGEFKARFGDLPSIWVRAPGRVDLMGSHTDYNEGWVLTMTIDREVWIAARPHPGRVSIESLDISGSATFDLEHIEPDRQVPWTNYVRGVAAVARAQGLPLIGFDGLVQSTVPVGSGVSSSAALEVAVATLFKRLGHWDIGGKEVALLCQRAENEFVGVSCGILDQYTCALGQEDCALLLDCRDLTSRPVPFHRHVRVVICDTRAKRELRSSEYAERRAQCEEGATALARFYPNVRTLRDVTMAQLSAHVGELREVVRKRCRFIIEENERVLEMGQALPAGSDRIRALCEASYLGARDLYEIGAPVMEAMMAAMLTAPGVIGARQAGAGFGGCMVAFVHAESVERFVAHVRAAYHASTGVVADVYPVRAVAGAGPLVWAA